MTDHVDIPGAGDHHMSSDEFRALGHALKGRSTIRVAIGSTLTEHSHVEALWNDITALA